MSLVIFVPGVVWKCETWYVAWRSFNNLTA